MAGRRLQFSPSATPVRRFDAEITGSPVTESEEMLLSAISGLSHQLTQMAESVTRITAINTGLDRRLTAIETSMASLEEAVGTSRASNSVSSGSKRRRRAHNTEVAGTVRLLHNSEGNENRYDPVQSLSSPHNSAVTSYLVQTFIASPDMSAVDSGVFISACKTYYETIRRNFRFGLARSRQRRKRLLVAGTAALAKEEMDFWRGITVDLMSDEEDGTADGEAVWGVKPPSFRS